MRRSHLTYGDLGLTLREVLNKLVWDPKLDISNYEITYIHRGAPMDAKTLSCCLIVDIDSSGFTYKNNEEQEFFIPFHRILEIRNIKTGKFQWKKKAQGN